MKPTPSALKWMAEKRGRLANDLLQTGRMAQELLERDRQQWRENSLRPALRRLLNEGAIERQGEGKAWDDACVERLFRRASVRSREDKEPLTWPAQSRRRNACR